MADDFQRVATASEVERMQRLVRQGMEEGAYGLSSGLEYVPGRWSNTEEVAALVSEIVPFGGNLRDTRACLRLASRVTDGGAPQPTRTPTMP